ncbi:hypothetical protein HU200_018945 [Digitaria exilis]|uniref:K Homology domain-containing protein n=1 Tax=Digitaria exilis TaxID=1010633 RepID=A0A835KDE6_9POAL|nr:hypothetical protein HU200_018945 [Digitaria exilis]
MAPRRRRRLRSTAFRKLPSRRRIRRWSRGSHPPTRSRSRTAGARAAGPFLRRGRGDDSAVAWVARREPGGARDEVGGVIERRSSTFKRLYDETRARVLDAPRGAANRIVRPLSLAEFGIVLVDEVKAELSPAMNAAIKIFKHINGTEEINSYGTLCASATEICYVRLLVPAAHAVHLIGKQGVTIKLIQESTGATIRIIDEGMLLST